MAVLYKGSTGQLNDYWDVGPGYYFAVTPFVLWKVQ